MSEPYDPAGRFGAHGDGGATGAAATLTHDPIDDTTRGDPVAQPAPPYIPDDSPDTPGLQESDEAGAPPPPPPPPTGAAHGGGSGWAPWGPTWWTPPPSPPARTRPFAAVVLAVLAVALVAAGTGVGFALARQNTATAPAAAGALSPGSSASGGSASASQIASKVNPAVVDVNTKLGYQGGSAAGTGVVLTSSGEVLTNNHVVDGATSIQVTDIGNGRSYTANVVGTDATDDVAVLRLEGASGLATMSLGNSSTLSVGDAVVAIGNAGGTGGTPSVSAGNVVALNQSISASDQASGSSEQLQGLIQTSATLQPGDSGGPLVNSDGKMVGIDTAASGGFQIQSGSNQNFAIPINQAITIANQIEAGHGSSTIHIGPAAFLGVEVQSANGSGSTGSGAAVAGVEPGTPADTAGLAAGDVIDSVGGRSVDSANTLSGIMAQYHPGDTVQIGWTDPSGQQHSATVQLASGPPA